MKKQFKAALTVLLALLLSFAFISCSNDPVEQAPEIEKNEEVYVIKQVKNVDINPAKPYSVINWGLYDNQSVSVKSTPRGGSNISVVANGRYSVFIPEDLDIRSKVVVILIPDNTSSYDFARTTVGVEWMKYADKTKDFAVAFLEPYDGNTWNTALAEVTDVENGCPRDERAFIHGVIGDLSSASINSEKPYISVDKSGVTLIGYEEGATMASVIAAAWPSLFANTILVDPVRYEGTTIDSLLAEDAYPHIIGGPQGYGNCKNGDIGMPLYLYGGSGEIRKALSDKWADINDHAKTLLKDTQAEPDLLRVTALSDKEVSTLYQAGRTNNRFMGYSGGSVRTRFDFDAQEWEIHEEKVDGDSLDYVRRWYIYTPSNLPSEEKVPLVTVLHGSSASIRDVAEESRWTKIADENGFVVLFLQGKLSTSMPGKSAPISGWSAMDYTAENPDNVYINLVIDKVIADRNIDESRLYLTGHSLGGMMTSTIMGTDTAASRFAAFAPVGVFLPPNDKATYLDTPIYALTGEWESSPAFPGIDPRTQEYSDGSILSFLKHFGMADSLATTLPDVEVTHKADPYDPAKFETRTYLKNGVPYLMHTVVKDSPHTYMADRARLIWEDFFSHYHRNGDGKAIYTE